MSVPLEMVYIQKMAVTYSQKIIQCKKCSRNSKKYSSSYSKKCVPFKKKFTRINVIFKKCFCNSNKCFVQFKEIFIQRRKNVHLIQRKKNSTPETMYVTF